MGMGLMESGKTLEAALDRSLNGNPRKQQAEDL